MHYAACDKLEILDFAKVVTAMMKKHAIELERLVDSISIRTAELFVSCITSLERVCGFAQTLRD